MSKYLVIGDAGHAEKVAGKCAPGKSLYEWKFNHEIDTKMKKRCTDHGIDYYQTNPSPAGIDEIGLSKRAELANTYWKNQGKTNALFISYHANAYYEKDENGKDIVAFNSARGTETYVASNASTNSKNAAKYINDEIYNAFKTIDTCAKNRGVKTKDFTVIYRANMPSILVEYGFYTNKSDLKILQNNVDDLVEATVKAICKYFGITYKSPKVESNTNIDVSKNAKYRVVTGGFRKEVALENIEYLHSLTGWWLTTREQADGSYCIITGGFDKDKAESKLASLIDLTGWWATVEEDK